MNEQVRPSPGIYRASSLLFISRKYPPSVGGMEQLSYHVTTGVARRRPARIIKWGGSQKWLPLFVPIALMRALAVLVTTRVAVIHIGDLVLAPLGLCLRLISRKPVAITAHGLDVLYPNKFYQRVIPACARHLDAVICISEHTRQACLKRGIRPERTVVIPVGVSPDTIPCYLPDDEGNYWLRHWGLVGLRKRILLTVGRLVPRKGLSFFVAQVLPRLRLQRDDWICLIIGDGPERETITAAVRENGLASVVRLLGRVSDAELQAAYALADVFVMPNVPLPGDAEGFGIVHVEARMAGLPVVAADLEGIADSFEDAEDGILIPAGDAQAFADAINRLLDIDLTLAARLARREKTTKRYSWSSLIDRYLAVFEAIQEGKPVGTQ